MNNTIKNALASATLTAAWGLAEFFLGWHTTHYEVGKYTGALSLVFPVWLLARSLKAERAARPDVFGFKRGVVVSLVFGAVSAAAAVPFLLFYYHVVNPAFTPQPDAAGYLMLALGGLLLVTVIGLIETAVLRRNRASAGAEKIAAKHG